MWWPVRTYDVRHIHVAPRTTLHLNTPVIHAGRTLNAHAHASHSREEFVIVTLVAPGCSGVPTLDPATSPPQGESPRQEGQHPILVMPERVEGRP